MEFLPDYIITWDFSEDSECPRIRVAKMYSDKKAMQIICDVIGSSEQKKGIVSLRQLLETFGRDDLAEEADAE